MDGLRHAFGDRDGTVPREVDLHVVDAPDGRHQFLEVVPGLVLVVAELVWPGEGLVAAAEVALERPFAGVDVLVADQIWLRIKVAQIRAAVEQNSCSTARLRPIAKPQCNT